MREIEFRGVKENTGNMAYGDLLTKYIHHDGFYTIVEGGCIMNKVLINTVGQYTGIKDRNGIKIFEGDIVSFKANYSTKQCGYMNGVVTFEGLQWMILNKNGSYSINEETDEFSYKSEVIGNIHQK